MSLLKVLLYCQFLLHLSNEKELNINLIKDLIKLDKYSHLTAYLCYNKEILIKFWKVLSTVNIKANFFDSLQELHYSLPQHHQFFIIDMQCNGAQNILNLAEKSYLLQHKSKWFIYNHDKDFLNSLSIEINSRIYILEGTIIKSLYKIKNKTIENFIASWNEKEGLQDYHQLLVAKNRSNVMKEELGISFMIVDNDTVNHFWDFRNTHIDTVSKMNYILYDHLKDFINCTLKYYFRDSWGYNSNASIGKYEGIIGDIMLRQVEFGGTGLLLRADRFTIFDYIHTTPPRNLLPCFVLRPIPLSYVQNVFTLPFQTHVWYACFLIVFLMIPILYVVVKWEWKDPYLQKQIEDKEKSLKPSFLEVIMLEIGAITQQGYEFEPQSNSGRITFFFAMIVLMFLYTAYAANIIALLQSTSDSISTLNDLLESRISLGVDDTAYARHYFAMEQEPIRKAIYEQKIVGRGDKSNFMTVEEGMRRVREEFFAFHTELANAFKFMADNYQDHEKCGIITIPYLNLLSPLVTTTVNSTVNELSKVTFRRMEEVGLQIRASQRLFTRKPKCNNRGSNFFSVGLIDCYAAFVCYGIGLGLSLFFLVIEKILQISGIQQMLEKRYQEKHV